MRGQGRAKVDQFDFDQFEALRLRDAGFNTQMDGRFADCAMKPRRDIQLGAVSDPGASNQGGVTSGPHVVVLVFSFLFTYTTQFKKYNHLLSAIA